MPWNIVLDILKLGLSGLVFLFAYLGYRLLSAEQKKETPNRESYKNIRFFNLLTFAAALMVGGFSLATLLTRHDADVTECQNSLSRLTTASKLEGATADDLRSSIQAFAGQCSYAFEGKAQ